MMKMAPTKNLDPAVFVGLLMQQTSWTDDAKAELHLLGMNLHDLSVELSRQHPCGATILEGYANRIDELMKRAPEAVS